MWVVCRSFTFKSSKIAPVSPESIDATLRLTGFFYNTAIPRRLRRATSRSPWHQFSGTVLPSYEGQWHPSGRYVSGTCPESQRLLNVLSTVRANAFRYNSDGGLVYFIRFGNESVSPEESEGPSAFVIRRNALEETDRAKVKEGLHYLAPEHTGSVENAAEDHRTDPYSLRIFV